MRKFDPEYDTFAPELEYWLVWIDGETSKTRVRGRAGALRHIKTLRRNVLMSSRTIRMKAIGNGTPF